MKPSFRASHIEEPILRFIGEVSKFLGVERSNCPPVKIIIDDRKILERADIAASNGGNMRRFFVRLLTIAAVLAMVGANGIAQATPQDPDPGVKNLELWVGAWTMTGFLKDSTTDKEHSFTWRLRGHSVLGGRAVQTDQEWIRDGVTTRCLEVLTYNRVSGALISYGVCENGGSWSSTLSVKGDVGVETGTSTSPDGTKELFTWTWTFSPDRMSASAVCETQRNGTKWVSSRIKGTKAR